MSDGALFEDPGDRVETVNSLAEKRQSNGEVRMIGGLVKSSSRLALMAAAGLFAGGVAMPSAKAADLGGDCCADLEERVAELEATTARKGNRKMSLTISGHVNKQIMYFSGPAADATA